MALRRERDRRAARGVSSSTPDVVFLPAEGRKGRTPAWPLGTRASAREREVWIGLWAKPQAVEWERLGQHHLIGLYVRLFVEAEEPGARPTLCNLVRQMADGFGLTTQGLRANRWVIGEPDRPNPTPGSRMPSARDRLKLVAEDQL